MLKIHLLEKTGFNESTNRKEESQMWWFTHLTLELAEDTVEGMDAKIRETTYVTATDRG